MTIETLREAYKFMQNAEKAIKRSQKETAGDVKESLLLLALDQIEKAKALVEQAAKGKK